MRCIGFPLPYLAMISHAVNVPGFLSLLCKYWLFIFLGSELSSGNFIYFHRFIYRTLQNHISNSLVISLPFSEIVGTSLTLPLHCELGFHPRWSWMAHHPPLTSSMTSQYHFTTHSCGHSLQLLMNWKHSALRMTNLNILCCDQSFLFFQFFLELYSHHDFSKASLDLLSFKLLSFPNNQPFDFTSFPLQLSYYTPTLPTFSSQYPKLPLLSYSSLLPPHQAHSGFNTRVHSYTLVLLHWTGYYCHIVMTVNLNPHKI